MPKVLFVSNVIEHITSFHLPYLKLLKQNGYEIHVITNANGKKELEYCDKLYDLPICRSPLHFRNIKSIKEAKKIISQEDYDFIHCHTPMGGVVGRIAGKKARKNGTKIIYTSHGFHFYKGAPCLNWLVYYTIEKRLAKQTDCIITINEEDYKKAKQFAPKTCCVEYMDGVGVDPKRFIKKTDELKTQLRAQYGFLRDEKICFYAAEFIPRKNHEFLIEGFQLVCQEVPNVKLLLAGIGPIQEEIKNKVCKLGLDEKVVFLGYRKDIPQLLAISDIVVSTSKQEGFPINVAEGIMTNTPCVVSDIRGNIDIINAGENGFIYKQNNCEDFCKKVVSVLRDDDERKRLEINCEKTAEKLAVDKLVSKMASIYSNALEKEIQC